MYTWRRKSITIDMMAKPHIKQITVNSIDFLTLLYKLDFRKKLKIVSIKLSRGS